jgi:heme-degrading monooxygenase HmoA
MFRAAQRNEEDHDNGERHPEEASAMHARVTTVQIHPEKIDEANSIFRDSVIPAAQAQKGFRAAYLLVDSATGKGMSITAWDSLEDLQANESSGFYQEQLAKFAPLFTAPPTRETYEVSVQAQA